MFQNDANGALHIVQRHRSIERPESVVVTGRLRAFRFGELVGDFANDFLQHILQRYDALNAAEFVNDNRHLQGFPAQQRQQVVNRHILGHELRLPHYAFRGLLRVIAGQSQQYITDMDNPNHIVHRFAVHRQAGMPALYECAHRFGQRCRRRHGVNIQARHHYMGGVPVVHPADGAHHINVGIVQVTQFVVG